MKGGGTISKKGWNLRLFFVFFDFLESRGNLFLNFKKVPFFHAYLEKSIILDLKKRIRAQKIHFFLKKTTFSILRKRTLIIEKNINFWPTHESYSENKLSYSSLLRFFFWMKKKKKIGQMPDSASRGTVQSNPHYRLRNQN